jgi:hypothetical protein
MICREASEISCSGFNVPCEPPAQFPAPPRQGIYLKSRRLLRKNTLESSIWQAIREKSLPISLRAGKRGGLTVFDSVIAYDGQ